MVKKSDKTHTNYTNVRVPTELNEVLTLLLNTSLKKKYSAKGDFIYDVVVGHLEKEFKEEYESIKVLLQKSKG